MLCKYNDFLSDMQRLAPVISLLGLRMESTMKKSKVVLNCVYFRYVFFLFLSSNCLWLNNCPCVYKFYIMW